MSPKSKHSASEWYLSFLQADALWTLRNKDCWQAANKRMQGVEQSFQMYLRFHSEREVSSHLVLKILFHTICGKFDRNRTALGRCALSIQLIRKIKRHSFHSQR